MLPLRLSITLLGWTVLSVEFVALAPPTPSVAKPVPQPSPTTETAPIGPATEHRAAPITQLGFQSRRWRADQYPPGL